MQEKYVLSTHNINTACSCSSDICQNKLNFSKLKLMVSGNRTLAKNPNFMMLFEQKDNYKCRYKPYQTDPSFVFVVFLFNAWKCKEIASVAL